MTAPNQPATPDMGLLKAMLDSTCSLLACMDANFNFIHVNRAYAEADNRDPAFFPGKNHFDLYPNEENERIFRQVKQTGQAYVVRAKPFEYREHPERGITYWDWSLMPIKNARGTVTALVLTLSDVTDRTVAEQKLRESQERLQAVLDNTTAIICIKDSQGRFLLANRPLLELYGCTKEEFIGKTNYDFAPPERAEKFLQNDRQVLETNRPGQFEEEFVREDGSVITFYSVKVPLRDATGKPYAVCGISTDITAKKRAERLLENYADTVAETAPVLVMAINPHGKITRANRFARTLTGYAEDDLIGANWQMLVKSEQYDDLQDLFAQSFEGRTTQGVELPLLCKNGRQVFVRCYSALQLDADGEPVGLLILGIDVTEVRQKEEQLRHAAKMEAIGRLAGGVAHDFNNYLTAISGYANLLAANFQASEAARQDIDEIITAADSAANLTKQLLAFGRQAPIEPEVINLNRVLGDIEKSLAQVLRENIRLVIRRGKKMANIFADFGQIQQVVLNLAINARDAMPGGGTLTISTRTVDLAEAYAHEHAEAKPGLHVELAVSDTGTGIDQSIVEHIFEPFFTTKPTGEGTGLGLATVHGIVTQTGGHLTVESTPGSGTTFRLLFPAANQQETPRSKKGRRQQECSGGSETILVAEDDEAVRAFTVRTLQRFGYKIIQTGSPVEALAAAEKHEGEIDLLLSDIVMPEMNGLELARALQSRRPNLPALFVSGYTKDALPERNLVESDIDLLTKPFTMEELCRNVRYMLDAGKKHS